MEALFQKRESESVLLDFTSDFKEKSIPLEVRTDLFTGCVSRILKFRNKLPDNRPDNDAIKKSKATCPFCPGHRDLFTPKFPASIAPEGRIQCGNAVVLPNAFPYSRYCGVTLFSDEHFLSLDRFTPQMLHDAFRAGVSYIDRVKTVDPEVKTASINWNYLMSAGGGLYHPHLQVVVNRQPSHFHQRLMDQSKAYRQENGKNYWKSLLGYEKKQQERYLFAEGGIEFISVFSPKGMFGEILALFTDMTSLSAIGDTEWASFQKGLSRILRCFHRMNLNSLNMTLLVNLSPCGDFEVQARITPRMSMPPWGTSDVNYFEKGHNEIIVVLPPEKLAEEIRASE
jgi:UDPglucose--hexose-1-phosphate uridylyltransferase